MSFQQQLLVLAEELRKAWSLWMSSYCNTTQRENAFGFDGREIFCEAYLNLAWMSSERQWLQEELEKDCRI